MCNDVVLTPLIGVIIPSVSMDQTLRELSAAYPDALAIENVLRCEHDNIGYLLSIARSVIRDLLCRPLIRVSQVINNCRDNQPFARAVIQSMCRLTSDLPNSALEDFSVVSSGPIVPVHPHMT